PISRGLGPPLAKSSQTRSSACRARHPRNRLPLRSAGFVVPALPDAHHLMHPATPRAPPPTPLGIGRIGPPPVRRRSRLATQASIDYPSHGPLFPGCALLAWPPNRPSSLASWLVQPLIDIFVKSSLCSGSSVITIRTLSPDETNSAMIVLS